MVNVWSTKGGEDVEGNVFPERMRGLRKKKTASKSTISELFGRNHNSVRRYENGESEPRLTSLINIAEFYEVSIDYLAGLTDDPTPAKDRKL